MKRLNPLLGALALLVISASIVLACSTPVHRYAMYNWKPSTYLVCYVCEGEEDPKDAAVNARFRKLMIGPESAGSLEAAEPLVNIVYEKVDVTDTEYLASIPPIVKETWEKHRAGEADADGTAKSEPVHMLFSPVGALLRVERFTESDVPAMIDSPARTKLGELLQGGNNGVLLFLPGEDEKENERARKEVARAIELAKVKIRITDPTLGVPGAAGDGAEPAEFNLRQLEVSRSDPAEKWLVEQLFGVDRELSDEERALPMVFCVYGRGRAMPPYLGEGVRAEGLLEVIAFVNGPCSCEVKDQNPGVDLLMKWDWEKAALVMAERVGRESGNELLLEESGFDYEEIVVEPEVAADTATTTAAPDARAALAPASSPVASVEDVSVAPESESAADSESAASESELTSDSESAIAAERGRAQASNLLTILLPVVGAAVLGLGLLTFVMMRRR